MQKRSFVSSRHRYFQSQINCQWKNQLTVETNPGECSCSAGFKDDACNATCPEGRFGLNCEETCECQKGTTKACDPVTGECLCRTGYRGVRCETQCPKGRYGPECRDVCHCENDGSCDNLGDCFCQRGWTGELCEDRCPTGNSVH